MNAIQNWVQQSIPAFQQGKVFAPERCFSMTESQDPSAAGFHAGCDGFRYTITVVTTHNGHLFGGVSETAWGSPSFAHYVGSSYSFLFCLKCKGSSNNPTNSKIWQKFDLTEHQGNAMYLQSTYGPTFGGGFDLNIADPGNTASTVGLSYANFGYSYACPDYDHFGAPRTTPCNTYFDGEYNFGTVDYEVFALK